MSGVQVDKLLGVAVQLAAALLDDPTGKFRNLVKFMGLILYRYLDELVESNVSMCRQPLGKPTVDEGRAVKTFTEILEKVKSGESAHEVIESLVNELKKRQNEFIKCELNPVLRELSSEPVIRDTASFRDKVDLLSVLLELGAIGIVIVPRRLLDILVEGRASKVDARALISELRRLAQENGDIELLATLEKLERLTLGAPKATQLSHSAVEQLNNIELRVHKHMVTLEDSYRGRRRYIYDWSQVKTVLMEILREYHVEAEPEHIECLARRIAEMTRGSKEAVARLGDLLMTCMQAR